MITNYDFKEYEFEENFEICYENIMIEQQVQTEKILKKDINIGTKDGKKDAEIFKNIEFLPKEKKLENEDVEILKTFLNNNISNVLDMIDENLVINFNEENTKYDDLYKIDLIKSIDLRNYFKKDESLKFIKHIKSSSLCLLILEKIIDEESDFQESFIIILNYIKNENIEIINVNGTITAISMHPKKNLCFSYGTNYGEIALIDLELNEKVRMKSSSNELFHFNAITNLEWVKSKVDNTLKFILLSTSIDGRLLLWDMYNKLLFPKKMFKLKSNKNSLIGFKKIIQINWTKTFFIAITNLNKLIYFEIERVFLKKDINLQIKFSNDSKEFLSNLNNNTIIELKTNIELNNKKKEIIQLDYILSLIKDYTKIYNSLEFFIIDNFFEDIYLSCCSPDYNLFVLITKDNILKVYKSINKNLLNYFNLSEKIIKIEFLTNEDSLIILNEDNKLFLFNISENKKIMILNYILNFELLSERKKLLAVSKDYKVNIYELPEFK